jgi:hypothetical protein
MTQKVVGPRRIRLLLMVMALGTIDVIGNARAYAQGGITSSLSGTVVDSSGSLIPGADVVVKNIGTGETFNAVTSENGTFNIPAINPGTYEVSISLTGFKRAVLSNVKVNAATPATVRATLDIGDLAEVVQVSAGAEIVQTQSSALSVTVNVKQISEIPLTSRNVLDFVPLLPGVNTPGGNRDSTIFGLPQSAINITYDGVNAQDNTLKTTDGFFTVIQARIDAVEEATITTGAQGADSSGGGTVQIRFVTRSGTNQLRGSAYHYYRNDKLNANTWFNERDGLPTPALKQNQPGFRVGGPIVIPGLWDGHNKGFFFVNYEEFRQPQDVTRNRTILHPRAEAGLFRYNTSGGVSEIDLLALAARNGQTSTMDPTIARLIADIRASVATTGAVTDLTEPLTQRFSYNVLQNAKNRFPTFRVDFNLTQNHRLSASGNYHTFASTPDTLNNREPFFPGFPATGTQTSSRRSFSSALRSTFGQNLVNEFRVGYSGAPVFFYKELSTAMWGAGSVADQGGFFLDLGGSVNTATTGLGVAGLGITNASNQPTPSSRDATTMLVENTMNWLKGKHSLSLGGSFTQANIRLTDQRLVPEVDFGIVPGDPANAMFTTTNFPNASAADLTRAQNLYALLTGRVATVSGNARIGEDSGEYAYLGPATQRARMRDFGLFVQDQWRVRQNLTINAGLRYELQLPFTALNDSYATATMADICGVSGEGGQYGCNLFQPGTLTGKKPQFINLAKGVRVYDIDWNNWAPSIGGNWTPTARNGLLGRLLGDEGDTSISGGFSMAYNRNGMSDFTGIFGANPGVLIDVNRNQSLANLGSLPLLFRDRARLDPPAFPATPQYPLSDVETGDVNIFDSKLQVPWSQSWQIGIQRAIGAQMAIEARYVGTRSGDLWTNPAFNFNEINVTENGFLNEFRLAQQNLQANIAAGRGATFRYAGPGTGTAPLPIFLAYFTGLPAHAAGDSANYSSALFTNNTFLNPLAARNPQPYVAANALDADAVRRTNALRAGLPANFIVANPDLLGGANVTTNGGGTRYNAMVLILKRRMSSGLQFDTSYTYGKGTEQNRYSFRQPWQDRRDSGAEGEIVHALKGNWVYELPFGRDRRFASNAGPLLDRLIGRWTLTGTARIQSGRLIDLGNVRLVGMTKSELGDMFRLRIDDNQRVWMLPQDVIDNTVKAFSVSATSANGYGSQGAPTGRYLAPANGPDCVEIDHDGDGTSNAGGAGITDEFGVCGEGSLIVTGPRFQNYDLSVLKQVPIKGRTNLELRFEILNLLNKANFVPVGIGNLGSNANSYEVTELTGTQTSRVMQLVARFNF